MSYKLSFNNDKDDKQVNELYHLLNENYVEDDECMFRYA